MRLLHVVPTYIPAYRYGGPIWSVHGLCRILAASGHEVHVLTTNVDGPNDSNVPLDRPVDRDGVLVYYRPSQWLRRLFYAPQLGQICREIAGRFDAVHLHSVFLYPTWAAANAATHAHVPYVLSPRGMLVGKLIAQRNAVLKRAWISLIERGNLRNAARIHLTSNEERFDLEKLGLALAPPVVIPNGVDAPEHKREEISRDVCAVIDEGFDILSFGRISWKKGLDKLIRALAGVSGARLLIAGHDEDGHASELRKVAEARNVANRVRFLPRYIGSSDREALFATCRLFALPSLSENFGNVVAEAMIRSVPVVVTGAVGAADLVRSSGGGVVVSGENDAELAGAISRLLASPETMLAMGKNGAAYAREHLSWNVVGRRFSALYQEIAAPAGSRQSGMRAG